MQFFMLSRVSRLSSVSRFKDPALPVIHGDEDDHYDMDLLTSKFQDHRRGGCQLANLKKLTKTGMYI